MHGSENTPHTPSHTHRRTHKGSPTSRPKATRHTLCLRGHHLPLPLPLATRRSTAPTHLPPVGATAARTCSRRRTPHTRRTAPLAHYTTHTSATLHHSATRPLTGREHRANCRSCGEATLTPPLLSPSSGSESPFGRGRNTSDHKIYGYFSKNLQ